MIVLDHLENQFWVASEWGNVVQSSGDDDMCENGEYSVYAGVGDVIFRSEWGILC